MGVLIVCAGNNERDTMNADKQRIEFLKSEIARLEKGFSWLNGYLIHAHKAEIRKLEGAKKSKKSR